MAEEAGMEYLLLDRDVRFKHLKSFRCFELDRPFQVGMCTRL